MKTVEVDLGARSYEIRIGGGLLPRVGEWLRAMGLSGRAIVVTDTIVQGRYAWELEKGLAAAGFNVRVLAVPPGEEQKTLAVAGRLYDRLAAAFTGRDTPVLALGGGVIGDLAGFVAATYMRGVPLVHVPTTLLAQVDSSIGGKTAVDRGKIKNIIGAFYQPRLIVADTDTLRTLPPNEVSNGLAEVIKQAAISDAGFFNYLKENIEKAMVLDAGVLEEIVVKNAVFKAEIIEKDEKEGGQRIILNYGHTIGHAVEAVSGYRLRHGQAVAIGMVLENEIARRMGILSDREAGDIKKVIEKAGLSSALTAVDKNRVLETMAHDKKVLGDKIRFVLLKSIGNPFVCDDVSPDLINEVLSGG
jgi:3-dehydroquinate synthase